MKINKSTSDLISELNKIEEDRVKSEEKEKQLAIKIKLQQESDNLKLQLEQQEIERKRFIEEEIIKKQNELFKEKIERLKNENLNVFIDKELCENRSIEINNFGNKDIINVEVTCKNKNINEPSNNNKNNFLNYLFSALLGCIISYFFVISYHQDDGVILKLERPKIMLLTEVIEKEVIVEKEVTSINVVKQQNIKPQVTNTKPQNNTNTQTNTKPKSKCPVSDPLCGIF
jgi:hypothetical protein